MDKFSNAIMESNSENWVVRASKEHREKVVRAILQAFDQPARGTGTALAAALKEAINQLQESPGVIRCSRLLYIAKAIEEFDHTRNSSLAARLGFILGVLVAYYLVLCFWAWVLGIILGWFGTTLPLWKNLLIILSLRGFVLTTSYNKDSKRRHGP